MPQAKTEPQSMNEWLQAIGKRIREEQAERARNPIPTTPARVHPQRSRWGKLVEPSSQPPYTPPPAPQWTGEHFPRSASGPSVAASSKITDKDPGEEPMSYTLRHPYGLAPSVRVIEVDGQATKVRSV